MKRWVIKLSLGFACTLVAGLARGQAPLRPGISLPSQPTVSPYINLLRNNAAFNGNTLTAVNYYGLVRPEFAFQNAITGLQQQQSLDQQLITTGLAANAGLLVTGHPAYYLNNGGYFLTTGAAAGRGLSGGGGLGGPAAGARGGAFGVAATGLQAATPPRAGMSTTPASGRSGR